MLKVLIGYEVLLGIKFINSLVCLLVFYKGLGGWEGDTKCDHSDDFKRVNFQYDTLTTWVSVFEDMTDTVVVFILYRLCFSLKRVEVQINPDY